MSISDSTYVTELPFDVVESEHTWIPMPDGKRLSARTWMPQTAEANPVPAILEYIPYRKRDGTRIFDDCRHRYWAGHGYACIRLDIRGTGESEGLITDEYPLSEQDDAIAAIDWIAEQSWCSGAVGMAGISWGGFNALQVAARRPPALKAIITHCSTDDRYADDVHWMGGSLLTDGFFWGSAFYHFMTGPSDPEIAGKNWRDRWMERLESWEPPASHIWMQHQRRDDYWRHGSICENYADIECAVYAVGGWEDGYSNAVPRLLANLECPRKGLVGPWGHKYPEQGIPGPAIGFLQEGLRWWDHWLKDQDEGIMEEPAYTVWMQEFVEPDACIEQIPGKWIREPCWPSANIVARRLTLDSAGLCDGAADESIVEHISPQSLGHTGGSWCPYGMGGSSPDIALDQREDDGRSLCFDSAPLGESLLLLGAPVVNLRIKVDQACALLAIRLCDVAPDGTSRRISYGLMNLNRRNGNDRSDPMTPGEWTDVSVQLNDLAHAVAPGHLLRLAISNTYWPMVWPSPTPVRLSLMTGRSTLDLPLRSPSAGDDKQDLFEAPKLSPVNAHRKLVPASSARTVERDLASGQWTQRMLEDGGVNHIEAIDLDVGTGMSAEFHIRENDPLSAEAVWHWSTTLHRQGWDIEIKTTTRLRASADEFLVDTDVDAREDGETVFARTWCKRIPRDGV
jgi:putative CocE/NonD family hydrolase